MSSFPTTTEELDAYIDERVQAGIAEAVENITEQEIAAGVAEYMQTYAANIEDNGSDGDVPLIDDNALDAANSSVVFAQLSNGVPVAYKQARIRAIAVAAAALISATDLPTPIVVMTSATPTIDPNVLNVWEGDTSELDAITVAFNTGASGVVNEYRLRIPVQHDGFVLNLPEGVVWNNDDVPDFVNGYTYEISIIDNNAMYGVWEQTT